MGSSIPTPDLKRLRKDLDYALSMRSDVILTTDDLQQLLDRLDHVESKLGEEFQHVIVFDSHGWNITHPWSCRPDVSTCPMLPVVNAASQNWWPESFKHGRYSLDLLDGELSIEASA